jgi:hypothetical protein
MNYQYDTPIMMTKENEDKFNKYIFPSIQEATQICGKGKFPREYFKSVVLFILKLKCQND